MMATTTDGSGFVEALQEALEPGERVLWAGCPPRGLMLRPGDIFALPFSLFWCGFVVFWMHSALGGPGSVVFALFGIPFVAIGLYVLIGRFVADAWTRRRTNYGVTDRRVLIVTHGFRRNIRSLGLEGLTEINLRDNGSGRGTITFGPDTWAYTYSRGVLIAGQSNTALAPAFERIEDAAEVLRLIRRAQKDLAQRG